MYNTSILSIILKATLYINDAIIEKNLQSIKWYKIMVSYVNIIGLCQSFAIL